MEGIEEGEAVQVKWTLEDLRVTLVHSRKVSVKALITFVITTEELMDEEIPVGVPQGIQTEMKMQTISVAGLAARKRDTCRVKDEVMLPMNQPNMQSIVWQETALRSLDTRLLEGQVQVKGELQLFVLYLGEEEPAKTWWISQSIPFNCRVDCPGAQEQMIGHVDVKLLHTDVEVKPDYDGELRVLQVDGILEVNMKIYGEEHMQMLTDLYSPMKELNIETKPALFEKLLISNASRCRVMDRLKVNGKEAAILQICNASGEVKVDEIMPTDQGLLVEGAVFVQILYVTGDDRQPFRCLKGMLPFEHILEAPGIGAEPIYHLQASLEQLHAVMVGSEEVEVKAVVLLNGLVLEAMKISCIERVTETPVDMEKIKSLPGMLIYVVQSGDTLWDIAKKYYTTTEQIRTQNELSAPEVKAGQRLLIIKEMGGFGHQNKKLF